MDAQRHQPVVLGAHLHQQIVGERLGPAVRPQRQLVARKRADAAASRADQGELGTGRSAQQRERGLVQEQHGDRVDGDVLLEHLDK